MSQALDNLLSLLKPEPLDDHLFQAKSEELGFAQLFGGQVVGQAIYAAKQTVSADKQIHSLHSYFLRPGDSQKPLFFDVEVLRDGQTLSARRVKAVQDGQPIFYMTGSFQAPVPGFDHQSPMPDAPVPDTLVNEQQLVKHLGKALPPEIAAIFGRERALEVRPVEVHNPFKGHKSEPKRQVWLKANGTLADDPSLHQALLGYASDFNFLAVSLQPHGKGVFEPDIQAATVDHSMWFHRPINLNEWLLYDICSPSASSNRGFVRGEFYNQQGELVASTVQEGVIRRRIPG